MKVTLNSAVPEDRRSVAEEIVTKVAPGAEIIWLPSRFPRLVMLVEPSSAKGRAEKAKGGTFFEGTSDSAASDPVASPAFALQLEEKLQAALGDCIPKRRK